MKIESSPDYKRMLPYYQMAQDFQKGTEVIKFGPRAQKYLPPSEEMLKSRSTRVLDGSTKPKTNRIYDLYRERAEVENYPEEVLGKLLGKLFSKPPVFHDRTPDHDEAFKKICHDGCDIDVLIARASGEYLRNQHGGLLIGWSKEAGTGGLVPSVRLVPALNLIKMVFTKVGDRSELTGVWIKTTGTVKGKDGEDIEAVIFEHLYLREAGGEKRVYTIDRYEPKDPHVQGEGAEYKRVEETAPDAYVGKLDFLPFEPLWPALIENGAITESTLHPLMKKTVSLYRNSANYEKGLNEVKFTYVVKGYIPDRNDDGNDLVAGSEYAWSSEGSDFSANLLEPAGTGLVHLKTAMDDKRTDVERLASELTNAKNGLPTATQANIVNSETGYKLAAASMALSGILTRVFQKMGLMFALRPTISVTLNTTFRSEAMDAATAGGWASLYERNIIGPETLVSILERGEVFPKDAIPEDEVDRLKGIVPGLLKSAG